MVTSRRDDSGASSLPKPRSGAGRVREGHRSAISLVRQAPPFYAVTADRSSVKYLGVPGRLIYNCNETQSGYGVDRKVDWAAGPDLGFLLLHYAHSPVCPSKYLDHVKQRTTTSLRQFDKLQKLRLLKITDSTLERGPLQLVPEVVTKLTSLEELDLSSNQINQLPDGLDKLQRLKILKIRGSSYWPCSLRSVPEVVTKLTSLEELDLSYNQIEQLPDRLDKLQRLKILKIRGSSYWPCSLRSVPEVVTKLTSLEELDLSYNQIDQLPDRLDKLQRLKILKIRGSSYWPCSLRSVSEVVTKLTSLEELDLSYNQIEQLPDRLDKLQRLKILKIRGSSYWPCSLRSVSEVVTKLTSLEELDLSYNQIEQLPDRLDKLQRLKILKIRGSSYWPCSLRSVPEVVTKLTSLEELDLSYNQIEQLPDRLDKLQRLKILKIRGSSYWPCSLRSVPEVVTKLTSLEELDLSYNQIEQLPDRLDKLQRLKILKIRGSSYWPCSLRSVPEVVTKLTSLEELDLSYNQIEQLPDRLDKLQRLKILKIRGSSYWPCSLRSVPEVVTKLTSLEELDLSYNQIEQLPDSSCIDSNQASASLVLIIMHNIGDED
ncbi:leucine-rich repeat protein soc-2-like [Watersipora subatra]|uniref:leucine-rich repeat protein soc-2-like n=1 Tax=Watersipora subatra TaxID=2589382 RepID=UPI00355C6539